MNQYIKYTLIQMPYYNANGRVLHSVKGRKNKRGEDEFFGGGYLYPRIRKALRRWVKDNELVVIHNITEQEAQDIVALNERRTVPLTYTTRHLRNNRRERNVRGRKVYRTSDFNATILTKAELDAIIAVWFPRGLEEVPY